MLYETVIFDLDGTLLNTLDDLHSAVNAALAAYDLPLRSKDEVRGFVGNGIVKLMERAVGNAPLSAAEFDGVLATFKGYYKEHCKDKTTPYAGIMPLLAQLQARGIKTAVVSNKADFAVKLLAEEYFKGLLMFAVGENERLGIRKKPAPDALLAVMERLGADKDTTVYVGDSEVDILTAQNADVDCISVTWGFKDRAFLAENGGKFLIDDPLKILAYCE